MACWVQDIVRGMSNEPLNLRFTGTKTVIHGVMLHRVNASAGE